MAKDKILSEEAKALMKKGQEALEKREKADANRVEAANEKRAKKKAKKAKKANAQKKVVEKKTKGREDRDAKKEVVKKVFTFTKKIAKPVEEVVIDEIEAPIKESKVSSSLDFNVKDASAKVRSLKSIAAIEAFVKGDTRATFLKVVTSRKNALSK